MSPLSIGLAAVTEAYFTVMPFFFFFFLPASITFGDIAQGNKSLD